jgi:uncharacterized membrane protein
MRRAKLFAATLIFAVLSASAAAQHVPSQQILRNRLTQTNQSATGVGNNPFLLIDYPGGIANQNPFGINDNGRMVGIVGLSDGSFKGYVLSGKTFKDIVYPGAAVSAAYGINKTGLIVGAYCTDMTCDTSHGFSLSGKTYTALDFPGGINTNPNSVNSAGDIAGFYQTPDFVPHAFMLHQGVFTSIDVPGAVETIGFGINNQGTIVGLYETPDFNGHGFILQNGVFTEVDYPGAQGTELTSINDSGDAVGNYNLAGDTANHGFLMSGGVFTSFDTPFPGSISTLPWGLNNRRQIVGSYGSYLPDYFFGFLTSY